MYHGLFIHSSGEERLGRSQFGAIMNKAALHIYVLLCGQKFSTHLGKYLGM